MISLWQLREPDNFQVTEGEKRLPSNLDTVAEKEANINQ